MSKNSRTPRGHRVVEEPGGRDPFGGVCCGADGPFDGNHGRSLRLAGGQGSSRCLRDRYAKTIPVRSHVQDLSWHRSPHASAKPARAQKGPQSRALPWGSEREGGPDPNLGQRDQFQVGIVPEVFVTVGKQHHPVGIQRGHRTLIVRDHDYGAREIGQRGQDLGA